MNDNERNPDQAENLRTRMIDDFKEVHGKYPPRSEIHKEKGKKAKLKMRYPLISLLAGLFILLPILVLTILLYYTQQGNDSNGASSSSGGDRVYIPTEQEEETSDEEEYISEGEQHSTDETDVKVNDETETSSTEIETQTQASENETKQEIITEDDVLTDEEKEIMEKEEEVQYKEVLTHKVGPDDTLFKIAIKYYNSRTGEEIIRNYNGIKGNEIFVGQELKIPIK